MNKKSKKAISTIWVLLAISATSAAIFAGCNSYKNANNSSNSVVSSSSNSSETSKNSDSSKTYSLQLNSNPSTGYSWSYSVDKEGIIKESKNEYVSDENSKSLLGVGGKQNYTFEGVKEGDVTITFKYARSNDDTDATTKVVNLHVNADGSITAQ